MGLTKTLYHTGRLFSNGAYTDDAEWVRREAYDVVRGNLTLAEEGLASYALEVERLKSERAAAIDRLAPLGLEIERLSRELRLAESARDYANDMLDRARSAAVEPEGGT